MKPSISRLTITRFLLPILPILPILIATGMYAVAITTVNAQPNISINGNISPAKTGRGRTVKATVVIDIPHGYHVHSNRPLEKFLIATKLDVEAPKGIRVGPVTYPRALLRNFKFSKNRVAVYEGRVVMRFNVTVPPDFAGGSAEIKAKVRLQSCNDEVCFPPQTKETKLWLTVQ